MKNLSNQKNGITVSVVIAIFGCIGTCITALLSSPIILRLVDSVVLSRQTPAPSIGVVTTLPSTELPTPTNVIVTTATSTPTETPTLTIEIVGPDTVPLGRKTYYTLLSQNASRAEWSVGGFSSNEIFVVDPLPPSHQIYIEPTDAGRVGEVFVLAVTVYNERGESTTATKQFTIVSK